MRRKGVASVEERRTKEGKQLRPVRVNLTSGDESGGTRLQIIRARAHSDGGKKMVVNCLFDTAAERSFIREDVAQELQLKRFLLC
ncbi:putative transcriptional regulatory protein [Trichinella spiralis]|uniref:Transcriptional regulatory protein n=1 Tax=Trichinella spiralis TaxID=6334 RepID=A0ABR3K953_TRISP